MIIRWELIFGLILILLSIAEARKVADENSEATSKCPMLTECPFRAEACNEDDDCSPDSICCKSPCGRVCTKQLFTGCQTLRMAASRRAKALGVDDKHIRMPRCNKVGGFETVQCDNEIVSSCWCVDESGFELAGTRAPAAALVNCTAPKSCADHTCRMFCPYGFSLSKDGCPLCHCRDPCDDVKCPNPLECRLEDLACADPPCPPVPTCKRGRSLDDICPVGDPLRISDTIRPFLCGNDPGKPQCPPLYRCLVQKGNDYGVCCPASLKIQKTGTCPSVTEERRECGSMCTHDLECPSVQKCCQTEQCGSSCIHPENVTECFHQREMSEVLAVSERAGKGYIPQCSSDGQFETKQCSRNKLVCWCVDRLGRKLKGSMGSADNVNCSLVDDRHESIARSLDKDGKECEQLECAQVCEYGFKLDEDGCHTCKCDDPCDGYMCPEDEECVNVKESSCTDFLCPSLPVCRPKAVYANPCESGAPLTDDLSGAPVACALRSEDGTVCPTTYECTAVPGSTQAVCCPKTEEELEAASSEDYDQIETRPQTMCEYLHNFSDNMEGTRDGMTLALPTPSCDSEGNYLATQCSGGDCWCVDHFGTEIPKTRGPGNSSKDCLELRETLDCLDLTCRMGCEYGFILSEESGCPQCQCRDPCSSVTCQKGEKCQLVEVSCKDHYCPPVPSCLPQKVGQCPYLIPATTTSCDFECNSDMACNGTMRCCSNGCGTQCTEPLLLTGCQHQRNLAQYQAHESGIPEAKAYIPECKEDGAYEPKQCNPETGECWCVDVRGFEVSKARTKSNKDLSCDPLPRSDNCPLLSCIADCDHGFKLNEKGCRTCECIDPCSQISCRGEGETCRLITVECVGWPCPSLPMCLSKKENPCQNGEPLKLGNSDEFVTCGPDFEQCPSSHKCQLSPVGEYAVCCPKPRSPPKVGQCPYLIPATTTSCDFECNSDSACNGTMKCCSNGCGTQCTEPLLLTACQHQSNLAQHQAHESGIPAGKVYMPRCKEDGTYEPKQCNPGTGECWCVDIFGFEISETRTKLNMNLSCDPPPTSDNCPLMKCVAGCKYGYKIDEQGCRTCECDDPCSQISCRGEGETCRPVSVECVSWPCPPLPMCLPKKENPCQNGEPLKLGNTDELVTCGPDFKQCPSSHKCQLSPVGEYAVCCSKPRDVCFEPLEKGKCKDDEESRNLTRYYFNSQTNKCERFTYKGCQGNHNNFHTEDMCNAVCPVLSQCERLREKNQRAAQRYKKPTFTPRCEAVTGTWQAVQCLEHVGVCWCVTPQGEPLKGTLTRGGEPQCNFRQARNKATDRMDVSEADLVLKELMMQIGSFDDEDEPQDLKAEDNALMNWEIPSSSRCEALGGQCDNEGKFLPIQCEEETCWCVDEAGNQLPNTNTFSKGERLCFPTLIEKAEVTLGFRGEFDDISAEPVINQITRVVESLDGHISGDGIKAEVMSDTLYIKFCLIGNNKVDVAYKLEQMVMQQRLPGLTADITRSRVVHKLFLQDPTAAEKIMALEQREIVSQSPVSVVAPYHTALIVIAAASSFVICVLTLLVILYRRKMNSVNAQKVAEDNQFLSTANRPIYIELPNEKYSSLPPDLNARKA